MKREEKNELSRRRILSAAIREFSERGYDTASLNTVCAENNISKGIIYHYFKDKDELYLLCVADCFDKLTAYLGTFVINEMESPEAQLRRYFDARLHKAAFFCRKSRLSGSLPQCGVISAGAFGRRTCAGKKRV